MFYQDCIKHLIDTADVVVDDDIYMRCIYNISRLRLCFYLIVPIIICLDQ